MLAHRSRSLPEVCEALGIKRRPAEAILTAAAALGFLDLRYGQYSLTPLAQDYLLDQSPTYFGTYLDLIISPAPNKALQQTLTTFALLSARALVCAKLSEL